MNTSPAPLLLGLSGVLWCAWGLLDMLSAPSYECDSVGDTSADVLFGAAGVTTSIALVSFAALMHGAARSASLVSAAGALLLGAGNLVEHCAVSDAYLIFVAGGLLTVVASVVLGVALLLRWTNARYLGAIVVLGALAPGVLSEHGSFFYYGLAWLLFSCLYVTRGPRVSDGAGIG